MKTARIIFLVISISLYLVAAWYVADAIICVEDPPMPGLFYIIGAGLVFSAFSSILRDVERRLEKEDNPDK